MKKDTAVIKKILVVAILLAVVTISIIAFVGVYTKNLNRMSNAIPDYTYGMDFEGNREFKLVLDKTENEKEVYIDSNGNISGEVVSEDSTDTSDGVNVTVEGENKEESKEEVNIEGYTKEKRTIKANEDSVLTPESYEETKKIIEKRLEKLGTPEYNVKLDEVTGNLVLELPDDENADFLYETAIAQGKFTVIDSQTGLELMNNSHIKSAKAIANSGQTSNSVSFWLNLDLTKEGKEIFKDMTKKYVETTVETEDKSESETDKTTETANADNTENIEESATTETETADAEEDTTPKTEIKYIEIQLDGETLLKTYFDATVDYEDFSIPLNRNLTTEKEINSASKSAGAIAIIIDNGIMPNKYELEKDYFLKSVITDNEINYIKIAFAVVIILLSVVLLVKFGVNGLIGAVLNVGYIALVTLVLRYTHVTISLGSIAAGFVILVMNFGFMYKLLKSLKTQDDKKKAFSGANKAFYFAVLPVIVVAFVFTYMTNVMVTGIGMILFWGLLIEALYNIIFTKSVYVLNDK